MPTSAEDARPLGARVLLTRSPDRAGAWLKAFHEAGFQPLVLPLIDFEAVPDPSPVLEALGRAGAGDYDWVVLSSITTLRAIRQYVDAQPEVTATGGGRVDFDAFAQGPARLATIGPSSRRIMEATGWRVDLAPTDQQSAAGLLAAWSHSGERILIPQSDIAGSALADGLRELGNTVDTVTAYRTVAYPARDGLRLTAALGSAVTSATDPGAAGLEAALLEPEQARALDAEGGIDVVIAASPSAARAIHERFGPGLRARFVAIGAPTAQEAQGLGISVAAVARQPTPEGIVAAATAALNPTTD